MGKRTIPYCLPRMAGSLLDASRTIESLSSVYSYFELWLDLLAEVEIEAVRALCARWPDRIVLLFRRPQLAPIQMPPIERALWLSSLAESPVWFDLDYPTQCDDLAVWSALAKRPKLILSHHDYTQTPDDTELSRLLAEMKAHHPTILKLAAFCQQPEDALRLLRWQLALQREGLRVIVLGMGEHGTITRIFGTLWGNEMAFAPPTQEEASAPGQLTLRQTEDLFAILQGGDGFYEKLIS